MFTAVGTVAFTAPALAAKAGATPTGPTEYVTTTVSNTNANDSTNTCRLSSNPCLTIQHAINQTTEGSTIDVGRHHGCHRLLREHHDRRLDQVQHALEQHELRRSG